MLKRNWIIVAALGITTYALVAQENPSESQIRNDAGAEQPASQPAIEQPPVFFILPTDIPGDNHGDEAAEHAQEHANDQLWWGDGLAQWLMAATGFFALLLSGWAVWLLKRTLDATKETLREANATTQIARRSLISARASAKLQLREAQASIAAMQEANRIASESAVNEQRPWIKIGMKVRPDGIWVNEDGFGVEYTPAIENVGNTPAFDLVWDNHLLIPTREDRIPDAVAALREEIRRRFTRDGKQQRGVTAWPHSLAPLKEFGGVGRGDGETAAHVKDATQPNHHPELSCIMLIGVMYRYGTTECFTAAGFDVRFLVPPEIKGKHVSDVVRIDQPTMCREDGRYSVAE